MKKKFPRTNVGKVSVSRMIIGTNWFLGFSHCTLAKDNYIKANVMDRKKIADILEVFFKNGVDTIMIGRVDCPPTVDAVREAENRTGVKAVIMSTPGLNYNEETLTKGFNMDEVKRTLDMQVKHGVSICLPHQAITDVMVDRCTRDIRKLDTVFKMIRERGMEPGLSTHMPETIIYADERNMDVETYISLYNSMGFLMQLEVDWISNIIKNAKKPVICIKPMAAGQLRPFQGLTFAWNSIRDKDMVTVGTMSPDEAAEDIELSLSILEKRQPSVELQETRSKGVVKKLDMKKLFSEPADKSANDCKRGEK